MSNNKSLLKNIDASVLKNVNQPVAKIVIGVILILIGIYWYFSKNIPIVSNYMANVSFVPSINVLIFLFLGLFGLFIFFIGVLLAWMGWDDYKIEKEMAEIKAPEKEVAAEEPEEKIPEEAPVESEPREEPEEKVPEEAPVEEEPVEEPEKEEEIEEELKEDTGAEEEYVCEECGKVLKSKAGLAAHKRSHK